MVIEPDDLISLFLRLAVRFMLSFMTFFTKCFQINKLGIIPAFSVNLMMNLQSLAGIAPLAAGINFQFLIANVRPKAGPEELGICVNHVKKPPPSREVIPANRNAATVQRDGRVLFICSP